MFLAIFTIVQLTHSFTSFYWGIYGVDFCFSISWSFKIWLNGLETNSPPLSDRNVLILFSDCISISTLNSLNFSKQSPLDFNTHSHTCTTLPNRTPHANQKYIFFLSCITKVSQNFIKDFFMSKYTWYLLHSKKH